MMQNHLSEEHLSRQHGDYVTHPLGVSPCRAIEEVPNPAEMHTFIYLADIFALSLFDNMQLKRYAKGVKNINI